MFIDLAPIWNRCRRALRNNEGSAAVEFAFIAPILILLLAGIIEAGLLFFTWSNMGFLGRQAARSVALGKLNKEQAENFIINQMRTSVGARAVTAVVSLTAGAQPIDNKVIVNIKVPADQLSQIQPFGLFRVITLSTKVSMYRETGS